MDSRCSYAYLIAGGLRITWAPGVLRVTRLLVVIRLP